MVPRRLPTPLLFLEPLRSPGQKELGVLVFQRGVFDEFELYGTNGNYWGSG